MAEPLLELRGVGKRWPGFALQGIDLALPAGMIMGLVGANGAGKTTLLKVLLGLVRADGGELRLGGRDLLAGGPELRRRIAYVPDEPRFVPELRLRAAKDAYARFHRDWDESRWQRLMASFGLDPAIRAGQLSLGMRTRFALTLALSRGAELLVLDEPTTGLDPEFRRDLVRLLAEGVREGDRSVLFSTHITTDLERHVDLVSLMAGGRMLFTEDQDALRDNWVLVKGGLELLDEAARAGFRGLRTTPYGFEGLSADAAGERRRFEGRALVERASLEDIVVLIGRSRTHAA
jgi:ABC-2 type transport system ATP-binding protein